MGNVFSVAGNVRLLQEFAQGAKRIILTKALKFNGRDYGPGG
jgi:hypothetical protein